MCRGKRGTIHQVYREGMEGRLGALGPVLNAIVLWTTGYIDAAVAQPKAEGHGLREEGIARLSPLKHRDPNLLGRYSLAASPPGGRRSAPAARPGHDRVGRGRRRRTELKRRSCRAAGRLPSTRYAAGPRGRAVR
ncbi:hypothetical protein SUDANB58_04231 [Streptomyces sp. enrichment culture]